MKYSIIIPNYNNAEWLEKCIRSVTEQTYQDTEIIFVDDMSSDGSISVVSGLLREQDKLIRLRTKRLQGGSRNEAMTYATGEYLIYLDSDDWLFSNTVIEDADKYICGQDVAFVGLVRYKNGKYAQKLIPEYKSERDAMNTAWTGSSAKIVKRELALRCPYDEGNRMEDRVQHYRVCMGMRSFVCIPFAFSVWNCDNAHSITTVRDEKWHNAPYRHLADYMDLLSEVPYEDTWHRGFINRKIREVKEMIANGGDLQL